MLRLPLIVHCSPRRNGGTCWHVAQFLPLISLFGSIRMEQVFMLLGQSVATAAVQSLEEGNNLHNLDYQKLRAQLMQDGQNLDVDTGKYPPLPSDEQPPLQRKRHSSEPVIEDGCMVTLEG